MHPAWSGRRPTRDPHSSTPGLAERRVLNTHPSSRTCHETIPAGHPASRFIAHTKPLMQNFPDPSVSSRTPTPAPTPAWVPRPQLQSEVTKTKHFRAKECLLLGFLLLTLVHAPLRAVRALQGHARGLCIQDRESLHTWLPAEGRMPAGTKAESSRVGECWGPGPGRWALGVRRAAGSLASMADGQSQGLLLGLQSLSPCPKSVGMGGGVLSRGQEEPGKTVNHRPGPP